MRYLVLIITILVTSFGAFAQEPPVFELADNASLTIPLVLMDRWGCSSSDIDRNGWPDIYNNKWRGNLKSQIYMNYDGKFTDIYDNSPDLLSVDFDGNATRTPVLIDYDNDGDRDLMIGTDYKLYMFRNDNNVFVDVTDDLGIVSSIPGFVSDYSYEMSAWIDWDNDGDLDALVAQTNNPDFIFYRNDGNQFVDIADEVGLTGKNDVGIDGDRGYYTSRIQWIDWDNDGDPDLNAGYKLFRNDDGFLNEVSEEVGFLPYYKNRFCDWFDYDLDGDFDYFLQGYDNRDELWENQNGTFVDVTNITGLELFTDNGQASLNIGDFDNDGDEDIFFSINDHDDIEAFLLNWGDATGRFLIEVAAYAGFNLVGDRKGASILDYDLDGLLDIFCPSLEYSALIYHNTGLTSITNNWIAFDLWGTNSNRDALGALVTLYAGDMKLVRYNRAARSWKIQDNTYIHFGIAQETTVDSVVIRWPLGNTQVITNPAINTYHKVEESGSAVDNSQTTDGLPTSFALQQNYPNPFNPTTRIDYSIPVSGQVNLTVFDINGRQVLSLVDGYQTAGTFSTLWNGCDRNGNLVPSGVYVYRITTDNFTQSRKMLFVK